MKTGSARRSLPVAVFLLLTLEAEAQDIRFRDRVDVESVVVEARVVDGAGRPVPGLTERDFRLKVDGHEVALQSVRWVADDAPDPVTAAAAEAGVPPPPPGRLIVFFFQKDLERSRIVGFMQMLRRAREMLDDLGVADRVAVVSFDSHLKLWTDFTSDRARLRRVLDRSILFEPRPGRPATEEPSLAAHFDPAAGRGASTPETALMLLGRALGEVPGPKSLVLFGWGMGRWSPGVGVTLENDYGPARRALLEARVTVFALDVTNADYHTLEAGLQQVADDTGGFYARTHLFPGQAMARLGHALAGRYVLTFARPDLPRGEHAIDLSLVGRKGTVLVRPFFEG
ncbi:MAG TPA: VWA domain-containing protein [Vicinamibacteria bacterium]|nr:VWA domain-containing protein [Vicinamibacteria bacterium]